MSAAGAGQPIQAGDPSGAGRDDREWWHGCLDLELYRTDSGLAMDCTKCHKVSAAADSLKLRNVPLLNRHSAFLNNRRKVPHPRCGVMTCATDSSLVDMAPAQDCDSASLDGVNVLLNGYTYWRALTGHARQRVYSMPTGIGLCCRWCKGVTNRSKRRCWLSADKRL